MAYTFADTSAKVGFRPYAQTDPFNAAHLSGLGQNHPFKPQAWHLHGLGDVGLYHLNRPFDPWELYDDVHHTAGVHGLSGLGALGDATSDAVQELQNAGQITSGEAQAILEGSMTFQDVLGFDPTDQGSWINAAGLLRAWNEELKSLEDQARDINLHNMQSGAQSSPLFQKFTRDLNGQRQVHEEVAQKFIDIYRTVTGSVPAGLTGLGIAPLVAWAAGAAAAIAAVYFGYQLFQRWKQGQNIDQLRAQTAQGQQQSTAANTSVLLAQLQKAQAAGDTVTAQAILSTLKSINAQPGAAEQWAMTNAKWIFLGVAGLIAIGPISRGLFGGRR